MPVQPRPAVLVVKCSVPGTRVSEWESGWVRLGIGKGEGLGISKRVFSFEVQLFSPGRKKLAERWGVRSFEQEVTETTEDDFQPRITGFSLIGT